MTWFSFMLQFLLVGTCQHLARAKRFIIISHHIVSRLIIANCHIIRSHGKPEKVWDSCDLVCCWQEQNVWSVWWTFSVTAMKLSSSLSRWHSLIKYVSLCLS